MGLFDVLRNKSKDVNLIHVKNMILVATADSVIAAEELAVITNILLRMKVSEEYFQRALSELDKENKIQICEGKVRHTSNALDIEAIPINDFETKLKYLQDYVLIMMSDGSIDEREKRICEAIANKMGLPAQSVNIVIQMIAKKTNGYGTAPAKNTPPHSIPPKVSANAQRLFGIVKSQAEYISENYKKLSNRGLGEARILCTTLVLRLCRDIDDKLQQEILGLLLSDVKQFIQSDEDCQIDFLNNRLDFYGSEINQFRQPTYTCMFIYNTLYVSPFTDDPHNLDSVNPDVIACMTLYATIVEVANNIDGEVGY